MKKEDFYNFLRKIPKAEIHLHAEATIDRTTVQALLDRRPNAVSDPIEVDKLFSYNNLKDFLTSFLFVQGLITKNSDIADLFSDTAKYLKTNNIVYAEVFFSPSMFLKRGLVFEEMIDEIQKAVDAIRTRDHVVIRVIVDLSRSFGVDNAAANLKATLAHRTPMIVGVGLGGDEEGGPAKVYAPVFLEASRNNLHVVSHAGEVVGPPSIWDSLKLLGSERIGHGLSAIQDPTLVDYLVQRQIPIEICITSNVITQKYITKAEDHPVRQYFDKGVLVTINTDDPTFFNCSIIDEFWTLHSKLRFTMDEIKTLVINGFKASFLTEAEKKSYISQVESAWKLNL
jgi:adenosine deaminase